MDNSTSPISKHLDRLFAEIYPHNETERAKRDEPSKRAQAYVVTPSGRGKDTS